MPTLQARKCCQPGSELHHHHPSAPIPGGSLSQDTGHWVCPYVNMLATSQGARAE